MAWGEIICEDPYLQDSTKFYEPSLYRTIADNLLVWLVQSSTAVLLAGSPITRSKFPMNLALHDQSCQQIEVQQGGTKHVTKLCLEQLIL